MQKAVSLYRALYRRQGLVLALIGLTLLWRLCLMALGEIPFSHDPLDSYTLQALAWRAGSLHLPQNIPALELAVYQGDYYVSFPPVPTIPLWILTFFYGEQTPNRVLNLCYFLMSFGVGYSLCRRFGKKDLPAALWAAFLVAGCNLLNLCWYGGVWYQAQALSFLLTLSAFRFLAGKKPASWGAGLAMIALAVGCRPFQAVYVPPALWLCYRNIQKKLKLPPLKALIRIVPLLIVPGLIALGYGLYNLFRFDNFFEFGHSYLPEVSQYGALFSPDYIKINFMNIFRLPWMEAGRLKFPIFSGFAFYLVNPLYVVAFAAMLRAAFHLRLRPVHGLTAGCMIVHFILLLCHRTFGGWQFGTRYLIDLCPVLFFVTLHLRQKPRLYEGALMILGVLVNLYGGLSFYLSGG